MDPHLLALIKNVIPKINDDIANGLAVREMKHAEEYVDRIFKNAAAGFPPQLKYEGYRRCTPDEEVAEALRSRSNVNTYDISRSDLYMVRYFFSWEGEELEPRHMYLPYLNDGSIFHLNGSAYVLSPVLADRAVSVGPREIFVPLTRDKLRFLRVYHHYYRDGHRESAYVVWSLMHHGSKKRGTGRSAGRTCMAHYLFCKYGVTETFRRFGHADIRLIEESDYTKEAYPPEQWTICGSMRRSPRGDRDKYYRGSSTLLLCPRSQWTQLVADLTSGFFYTVDRFPDRIKAAYVDDTRLWRVLLGLLLIADVSNEGKLVEEIDAHITSLDSYLDTETKSYLRTDGILAEDVYELIAHVIETFNVRVNNINNVVGSMWGKRVMILRYVLKDITTAINLFVYKLTATRGKVLTKREVENWLRYRLKTKAVNGINRTAHGEKTNAACPGDNKFLTVTRDLISQTKSSGSKKNDIESTNDPAMVAHASIMECGSYNTMSKSDPTGRKDINPFMLLRADGEVLRNPKTKELLDAVQLRIQR